MECLNNGYHLVMPLPFIDHFLYKDRDREWNI